jgi:hypothetical protein
MGDRFSESLSRESAAVRAVSRLEAKAALPRAVASRASGHAAYAAPFRRTQQRPVFVSLQIAALLRVKG